MQKKLLFLLSCFLTFSCTDPEEVVVPEDILKEEKMAQIFTDLSILEASMNVHVESIDPKTDKSAQQINIYAKHGITKEQFEESYRFYTENPEKMNEVYQLVLNDLSKLQAKVMNEK
ncbi:MAG: hypothetical protein K0Q95_1767 [Bacteroidota bacterium]|nr:hypothetical protein [Bacteroidota bacterium]